ncbi:LysR family transcriptional regulator [Anoxynatronum buryatiense]|uniref:DNA-binding transcriptional regulator, LysR family n=1 Tax=Anoxynatronum buryatiense TaxID=489973 RepID=A0AA45WXU4_9CLOT|nr:LysR family transcriptional regulator [Anoxynatronum buryatiense]SMP66184.1 DNA-binding transcriptional regulator, LysR family [Anoxynatronum buryatiense]
MDIVSLCYFKELAKELHMTNTANRLHISQQTLSNHIKRLEEHYGTLLFHRKPSLMLTYAGEQMLHFARNVVNEEKNIRDLISEIENKEMGALRFGASTARGMVLLPEIIPKFNTRFPNVEIRFKDSLSSELELLVENGDLDFAIVLPSYDKTSLIQQHIFKDQIYLCVPESLLNKHYAYDEAQKVKKQSLEGADLSHFSRLPFSLYNNRLGDKIKICFESAGFEPKVHFTTSYSQLLVPFCAQGISACFITRMNLSEVMDQFEGKVNVFQLHHNGQPFVQNISIIHHKQRYLPHYGKHFLEILCEHFEMLEKSPSLGRLSLI